MATTLCSDRAPPGHNTPKTVPLISQSIFDWGLIWNENTTTATRGMWPDFIFRISAPSCCSMCLQAEPGKLGVNFPLILGFLAHKKAPPPLRQL